MENLRFLKIKVEKHPTRNVNLEYLEKENAVAAMILDADEKNILLVEQYRPGAGKKLLEIPAGIIEKGEKAIKTLGREIREETGYEMDSFEILYEPEMPLILSPGYTSEELYIYIIKLKSKNEKSYEKQLDEGEDLECYWHKLEDVKKITKDFKTHYAIELYKNIK